jgi:general secretion pathway protein I
MGRLLKYRVHGASRPTAGFSLIEVMVALAILTISLTSVYRLQSVTFDMSADARFYTLAPMLAQERLAAIEREGLKNAADSKGDFGQAYPGYSWSVRIEEVDSDLIKSDNQHFSRIDVTIEQNEERSYDLRTYRFHAE